MLIGFSSRFSNYHLKFRKYLGRGNVVFVWKAWYYVRIFNVICSYSWNATHCYSVTWRWLGLNSGSSRRTYRSVCSTFGKHLHFAFPPSLSLSLSLSEEFTLSKWFARQPTTIVTIWRTFWFSELYLSTVASSSIWWSFNDCCLA